MKYKTQDVEGEERNNPLLEDIVNLLALIHEFLYAIDGYKKLDEYKLSMFTSNLTNSWKKLKKLAVCLDVNHKVPTVEVFLAPANSIEELKDYEEKYYNMLKEIAKNALEMKEVEALSYLLEIIKNFEHYFCTLNEDNVSRETSSQ